MSRVYEVMFIIRPDVDDDEAEKLITSFITTGTAGGGVVKSVEKLGRRKLAYMVRKFNDGNYVLLTIEASGPVVLELERRLRVTEPVIKFITVRIDEEEKRLAKVKAARGTRRKATTALQRLLRLPLLQLRQRLKPRLRSPCRRLRKTLIASLLRNSPAMPDQRNGMSRSLQSAGSLLRPVARCRPSTLPYARFCSAGAQPHRGPQGHRRNPPHRSATHGARLPPAAL